MTRTELARVVAEVNALWPQARWEADTIRAAEALLLDLNPGVALRAVHDLASEAREFAPPPGVIRRRTVELSDAPIGIHPPSEDEAMAEVYEQIRRTGVYRVPTWSHPAIGAVVQALGGWEFVCLTENQDALRAHFFRLYTLRAGRAKRLAVTTPAVRALLTGSAPSAKELSA